MLTILSILLVDAANFSLN